MYKLDLHTHSIASPDGGISPEQYAQALENEVLDFIAITDHNRIDFAVGLHKALGNRIIVGEEINTTEGELVGLYITEVIEPGQPAIETATLIKKQGGLVYVPHPFETMRHGVSAKTLKAIEELVDIVEIHNGRAVFQNFGPKAAAWAKLHNKAGAVASDAHGAKALGHSYNIVTEEPSVIRLADLLTLGRMNSERAPLKTLLYPKTNRLLKKLGMK